jgi:hypothetical protein
LYIVASLPCPVPQQPASQCSSLSKVRSGHFSIPTLCFTQDKNQNPYHGLAWPLLISVSPPPTTTLNCCVPVTWTFYLLPPSPNPGPLHLPFPPWKFSPTRFT